MYFSAHNPRASFYLPYAPARRRAGMLFFLARKGGSPRIATPHQLTTAPARRPDQHQHLTSAPHASQ
eukprot:50671-Pyramimonas_sp.AAC.1